MIRFHIPLPASRLGRFLILVIGIVLPAAIGMLLCARGQAQPPAEGKVLYLVEYVHGEKAATERLVRATLKADGTFKQETVVNADRYFFGDPGKARVVDKRYIVTEYGGVIDARDNKIIHAQGYGGQILGIDGGRVIFSVYDLRAPRLDAKDAKENADKFGIFAFDLAKQTRARPGEKHWALSGTASPDRSKSVYNGVAGTLWLELDGKPKELGKTFAVTHAKYAEHTFDRRPPILWLDNERILTQQGNGKIVTVDMQGTVSPVCEIAAAPATNDSPRLSRDPNGRIVYQCGRNEYLIDVQKKSAAPLEEYVLGHGFETPVETGQRGFRTTYYKGAAIGAGVFVPADVRTAPELIAMWNLGDGGSRRYVGVLWTKLGFSWRALDMDYCKLIGWAE